jgi:bisphosphoglycerate-independent phosphoglycerate mutase (AlkP superfamily)
MSLEEFLSGLKEERTKELALELFNSQNIHLKTEYSNPERIAVLQTISEYINDIDASNVLKNFIKFFSTDMVSFKRKSRREFVEAIKSVEEKDEETEKLKKFLKV